MTTEELKLVLETLNTATEEGKSAFLFWVFMDVIPEFIWAMTFTALVWVLANKAINAMTSQSRAERCLTEVAEMVGLRITPPIYPSECRELKEKLGERLTR